jgi:chromate reductase
VFDESNPIRVLGISGSLRRRSYNTAALRAAGALMPDNMVLEIAEIIGIPLYNEDDERDSGFTEQVQSLRDKVMSADALLIATPEYNYSLTGALKNAIDWLSRPPSPPINLMPVAVFGAGGRLGTARAQRHFRDIALHNDLRLVQQPEVLISEPWDKFDDDLVLTDERTRDQLHRLVIALRGLTTRIRATRMRVLVVGRHSSAISTLTTRLREIGYEPVAVLDDDSALALIDPGQFSIVIIDDEVEPESRAALTEHISHIASKTAVVNRPQLENLVHVLEDALG